MRRVNTICLKAFNACVAALLFVLFLASNAIAQEPPRTALVMGVGDYGGAKFKGGTIPNLPGITMADLPGMEAKLKSLGFSVTVVSNPTLSEAKEAVDAFSAKIKAAPGVSLFYFSGHGGEYEGKNYLIPRGANISSKADLSDEALSAQRVLNGMEESGAQVNLVFLDCCREDLGKSVGGAELQPMKARGSFIGFATRSGDFADPGAEGSPYTRFLLQHLDRPGLSVADMYGYVIKDVKDYTKKMLGEERRPGFYSELEGEPFYFVPVKFTPGSAPAAAAMSEAEIEKRAKELAAKMAAEATMKNTPAIPSAIPAAPQVPLGGKGFTNSLGMKFVPVPGTQVLMCIHETRNADYAAYAAAQSGVDGEWQLVAEQGKEEHPVVIVSYEDTEAFCQWLSKKEGRTYRLPTDEEWNVAAGKTEFPWGSHFPPSTKDGNYDTNLLNDGFDSTAPVMSFHANELGIFDLGGNVWEWCSTWYKTSLNDAETRKKHSNLDFDAGGQNYRVLRGGSFWQIEQSDNWLSLRSSYRFYDNPANNSDDRGFRVVCLVASSGEATAGASSARQEELRRVSARLEELYRMRDEYLAKSKWVVSVPATDKLSIRSGPGVNYPVIARLDPNTKVQLSGDPVMNGATQWVKIVLSGGQFGWAVKKFIREAQGNLVEARAITNTESLQAKAGALAGVSKDKPYQNSLGMAFVPAGTPRVLFSVWETRVKDFEAFVEDSGHDAISENAYGGAAHTLEKGNVWKQVGGSWRDPRFPSNQSGEHPVVCVSYLDAEAFCTWLTKKESASGKIPASAIYRLPTDAEWSSACGISTYPWGDNYPPKSSDGNYSGQEAMVGAYEGFGNPLTKEGYRDSAARTAPVGVFTENRFGLCDMGGNVSEWCRTWYAASLNDADLLKELPVLKDDRGGQAYRVLRGASWGSDDRVTLRSSFRNYDLPTSRDACRGFRCVLMVAGV
jgi:formylglycine-generating enzyme required for sulfatase activity